ncbi:hypothetical protein E2C01_047460 [Portunus trituberculatus]|uniref:Uncharacterized protein n=1 Tax=Portunus trituberculatus TaxID=210409 RepID=A0A5B7G7Y9_PORTR|nr:hypothetical protein [Portunus trituberculatus]
MNDTASPRQVVGYLFTSTAVMLRSGTAASEHVQEERRRTCWGERRCTQGLACLVNSGARGGCHMGPAITTASQVSLRG